MKKRKILIAIMLMCMTSQYALSKEINEDFNSGNKSLSLTGENTGSITNSGTGDVSVSTNGNGKFTGTLKNSGGGKFTNKGKVATGETGKIENSNGTFNNEGSITVDAGGALTNSGTLFNNSGNITVEEGGLLVNEKGSLFSNADGANLTNKGDFTNSGLLTGGFANEGLLKNLKDGTIFLMKDDVVNNSGNIDSEGTILINEGSTFTNTGDGKVSSSGQFSNLGKYESDTELLSSGYFTNDGEFTGGLINDGGTAANNATMDKVTNQNGGVFGNNKKLTSDAENKDGATFRNKGEIGGNVTNSNNGNFENTGTIVGNVTNDNATFNNSQSAKLNGNFDNKNGAVFNNESDLENIVTNESGSIFNNKGKIYKQVKNKNATVNNEGQFTNGIKSQGGVVNNSKDASLGSTELSDGATVNNAGNMGKVTGSDSTVNNSGSINGAIEANNGGGLTVNNDKSGQITNAKIKGDATVNNSGTMSNANISGGATVNNLSEGTMSGNTNVSKGSTLFNDGTISNGVIQVDSESTLHLGANSDLSSSSVQMHGHLDLTNGSFDNLLGKAIVMYGGSSISSDISSATGQTDVFSGMDMGSITLKDFNFIPDTLVSNGFISKEELEKNMGLRKGNLNIAGGVSHTELSPLRWLNATSTENGIGFAPTGNSYKDFNPAVMAAPVAAQIGGYLNQLNSYDEAFRNMDMYMLMTKSQRQAMKNRNKYAAADSNLVFDPTSTPYENTSAWFRPYATFENVQLKGGPKVSNVAWGSFFGVDSELIDLGNGWDGMFGAYVGYNGSHQAYDGVGIYQNGATLGLVGMAYKDNYFAGLTANVGSNIANADTLYGSDDFTLLMSGVAAKTGYNWELADGKFIIQPNYMMSYSFVNTFDYTTSSGIRVNGDPLHAIAFEPGVKFIGNLNNGWQPYAGVSVVWNILDKTQFQASDATLPELSVKPFVKYGVGIRKTWGERLVGFFQTFFTSGGRNGVGLQAGVRITLGNAEPKHANSTGERKYIAKK